MLDFFRWVYKDGRAQAEALHFVPLPQTLIDQVEAYWAAELKY